MQCRRDGAGEWESSWRIGAAGAQKYAADRKCIENGRSKKDEHEAGKGVDGSCSRSGSRSRSSSKKFLRIAGITDGI